MKARLAPDSLRLGIGLAMGALVLSAACWGLATVLTKGLLEQIFPFTLLTIQLVSSVTFLWIVVAATRTKVRLDEKALRAASTGLLEPGLAYTLGVPGLALTTAASASVIGAAEPALIVLLAWLLLREAPSKRLVLALAVALAGITLVTLSDLSGVARGGVWGNLLVLFGTLFAALYVVFSSRMVAKTPPLLLAALQQTVGLGAALILLASALSLGFERLPGAITLETWLLVIASGIVQYALGFWFYLLGMRVLPAGIAGLFLALIPVFGVGGAVAFLGESVTLVQVLGATLIIGAVLSITRTGK